MVEPCKKEELLKRAVELWMFHGIEYRTLIDEYDFYQNIKRNLGLKMYRINKLFLSEYPDIEFLKFSSQRDMEKYLRLVAPFHVQEQLEKAEKFSELPIVVELKAHNRFSEKQIRDYRDRKSGKKAQYSAAMNPDACGSGKHYNRTRLSYSSSTNSY